MMLSPTSNCQVEQITVKPSNLLTSRDDTDDNDVQNHYEGCYHSL